MKSHCARHSLLDTQGPGAIKIAALVPPEGANPAQITRANRQLLDRLFAREQMAGWPLVAWYYTPMALAYSDHLAPDLTVYDCMDELTAFKFAPTQLRRRLDPPQPLRRGGLSPDRGTRHPQRPRRCAGT